MKIVNQKYQLSLETYLQPPFFFQAQLILESEDFLLFLTTRASPLEGTIPHLGTYTLIKASCT